MFRKCPVEPNGIYDRIDVPTEGFRRFFVLDDFVKFVGGGSAANNELFKIAEINFDVIWEKKVAKKSMLGHPPNWGIPHADSFSVE